MKKIRIIMIVSFFALLSLPILTFNWKENVISEIDNRQLTNNPFGPNSIANNEPNLTVAIKNYVEDRIGLRDQIISSYTLINDKLFHKMIHPSYEYGKDGYVFSKISRNTVFDDYHVVFADMVAQIQQYCAERNVPFVFVFNPSKASVLTNKLPSGVNYENNWVNTFFHELDKRGVNYVDNLSLLKEKASQGESVFNPKYDAGHWNDLGAFYGTNQILSNLKKDFPNLLENTLADFTINQKLETTLKVSRFPIHELVPDYQPTCSLINQTELYQNELKIHDQYKTFGYFINPEKKESGMPKALVFQGSYMNTRGYKFLQNALGEYVYVHDYQNVINFDYYFNIFQPDCVIFEVAEYTFSNTYFDYSSMKQMDLPPVLTQENIDQAQPKTLSKDMITKKSGNQLVSISFDRLPPNTKYAYVLLNDQIFTAQKQQETFTLTIDQSNDHTDDMTVIAITTDGQLFKYQ